MTVFIIGYPSEFGGADTELWHTVKIWRRNGVDVCLIPTWRADGRQRAKLEQTGASTWEVAGPDDFSSVPGLAGSIVVSFCNGEFLKIAASLHKLDCKLVWVNCMTWAFGPELSYYEQHGPFSAYVFQSVYQQSLLAPIYAKHGAAQSSFHLVRGAFDCGEFPFQPRSHRPDEPFVMGRIARDDPDKWSSNLWPIYSSVRYTNKRARLMAWSERLTTKCGAPPAWAETLAPNAETAQAFLNSLHCLFPINGGARENWPRAGLEAMSSGVPVVAQREWGWCEMIEHGVTGFLGSDDCELAHFAAMLAHDEELRLQIARKARERLVNILANPACTWSSWRTLFASLGMAVPDAAEAQGNGGSHPLVAA
jgi:hypothetical protein